MVTDQPDEQRSFIVYRDDASILMTWYASQQEAQGVGVTYAVWRAVVPIALARDPDLVAGLVAMEVGAAPDVGFDDDLCSLFFLLEVLAATTSPIRAAQIARSWIKLPPEMRVHWWQYPGCDESVHAQILGATSAGAVTLDSVVPGWLVKLVETSRRCQVLRDEHELHWTWATTPLGSSCIAWVDDDEERPQACLAISDCGVQFYRADDPDLTLAARAITMLVDALGATVDNPEIAGLHLTGHDAMELYEILQSWMQRLTAAAEAAKALGLSTPETWEWIRGDGGRFAG